MQLWKPTIFCLLFLLFSTVSNAKILFNAIHDWQNGSEGLYVMDDNGGHVAQLLYSENDLKHYEARWAPDGKLIGFTSNGVFFLMNPDGTNIRQLTEPGDTRGYMHSFDFSPDGKSIVFQWRENINRKAVSSVRVLNVKTGKIKKIADLTVLDLSWSPNGKYILFVTPVGLGAEKLGNSIYIMDSDGDNVRELIGPPFVGELNIARWDPKWSPDGKKIMYKQDEYTWEERKPGVLSLIRKAHRYIICDTKGKTLKRLNIPKQLRALGIDWMDNGKSIVFNAWKVALNELPPAWGERPPAATYKYDIGTGKLRQLTQFQGDHFYVDWISDDVLPVSPKGKMQTQWGKLKKFIQSHSEAFKSLSQNVLFLLRNQH